MSNFCSKCGARVVEDSLFCETCGSKLKPPRISQRSVTPRTGEPARKPVFSSNNEVSSQSSSPSYYRPYHRSSTKGIKWLFVGIFFIVIIGLAAVVFFVGIIPIAFNRHNYIGDKTYSIDGLTNTSSLELEIDNSIGAVDIEITNMTNLLEARILVYAQEDHTLQDANTFEDTYYDNRHYVSFDSSSGSYRENPYYYELEIALSNLVTTALDVDVSTGSISVVAHETNISFLSLETSTGSICAEFQDVFFDTANNLTIHTSTGSITADFNDLNYSSDEVEWIIHASTGSIDFDILQEAVFNHTQINYYVDTSTGSINFYHDFDPVIGLLMYADVSTGSISTSERSIDDHYTYASENYASASMKFYVSMDTSTGSIRIDSFQ